MNIVNDIIAKGENIIPDRKGQPLDIATKLNSVTVLWVYSIAIVWGIRHASDNINIRELNLPYCSGHFSLHHGDKIILSK